MKSAVIGIIIALGLSSLSHAYPTSAQWDPEQGDNFEGDIILSTDQRIDMQLGARNGLIANYYRWPEGKIYYKFFKDHFDAAHKNHILRGMQLLEEVSCIRFIPANETTTAYINITGLAGGCYSTVGNYHKPQPVNLQIYDLDKGCFRLGTIVHEFLHALGFYHQQSTYNRDNYVKIVAENIQDGKEGNFNVYSSAMVDDFGIEYDYGSVMHYSSTAFSKNGEKTIVPLDPTAEIGQRIGMSQKDIHKLNIMYKCPILVR